MNKKSNAELMFQWLLSDFPTLHIVTKQWMLGTIGKRHNKVKTAEHGLQHG